MSPRNNKERQKYSVYRTRRSLIASTAKKLSKESGPLKRLVKRHSDDSLTRHLVATNPDMAFAIDGLIMAEEMLWEHQGKHVIFPQSVEFIERLVSAKYDLAQAGGFELPFPSFMLAMPKGFSVDGVRIGGIMVTSYKVKYTKALLDRYSRYLKQPMDPKLVRELGIDEHYCQQVFTTPDHSIDDLSNGTTPDDDLLCVMLLDGNKDPLHSCIIRGSETFNRIPALLAARSPEEFHDLLGPMDKASYSARGLSAEDAKMEFYAFRIVCALAVYNMATHGDQLVPGLPGGHTPHLDHKVDRKGMNNFSLKSVSEANRSPGAHYRQWHFRQLRDKRYYQREHATKPIGSRWVFVSDAMVGEKAAEPYTIESSE